MVEPRKPRVIRTRPGTVPPAAAGTSPASKVTSDPIPVRNTSSKVSVEPLPLEEQPAKVQPVKFSPAEEKPAAAAAKESPKKVPRIPSVRRRPESAGRNTADTDTAGQATADPETAGDESDGLEQGAKVLAFPVSSYKRRRRNILLAVAGIVATLALVMGVAIFSPVLAVQKVVFDGNKLVGADVLQKVVAPILSKPLPQGTEREVQDLLAPVIQVKSARIEARPPSTLLVHIVERVPVALIKSGDAYLLVDQDGVELGSTTDLEAAALPLIDGGKAAIGQDTFRAITAVLANLPQPIVAQLANASAKSPDAVELKLTDGRTVIWGNASDMELKAEVLTALLTAPPPTPEPGKPVPAPAQVFDVSAPRHPVTR